MWLQRLGSLFLCPFITCANIQAQQCQLPVKHVINLECWEQQEQISPRAKKSVVAVVVAAGWLHETDYAWEARGTKSGLLTDLRGVTYRPGRGETKREIGSVEWAERKCLLSACGYQIWAVITTQHKGTLAEGRKETPDSYYHYTVCLWERCS